MVGAFTDGQTAFGLATVRTRHIAGTKWSIKRYMNLGLLKQQKRPPDQTGHQPQSQSAKNSGHYPYSIASDSPCPIAQRDHGSLEIGIPKRRLSKAKLRFLAMPVTSVEKKIYCLRRLPPIFTDDALVSRSPVRARVIRVAILAA